MGRSRSASAFWKVLLALVLPVAVVASMIVSPEQGDASTPTTVPAGAYIIDMGAVPQTVNNGLKPYGMVYDLIVNQRIPVTWAINDAKLKDGVDFTFNAKNYSGGPFIIMPEYASAAAATVATWRAQGVVVDGPTTSGFTAPVHATLTSWPRVVLDTNNGGLAAPYYTNAGIPATSYRSALPSALTACDDLYVMPHADPTWATHSNLRTFNNNGGFIWAACHAVSVLENVDNPGDADTAPDLNFLSTTGLVPFGSHADGSPPYSYATTLGADPIMQFIGVIDGAQLNGSEQIYLPRLGGGWRPSTTILGFDPTQANVPALSPGPAATLLYGRGYGVPTNGLVMYEGGHSLQNGAIADRVAGQRAFFNLHLQAGIERSPKATATAPSDIGTGATVPVATTVTGGTPGYTYQWTSSCGGSFASSTSASTNFTAPTVSVATPCILRVVVTDSCGRRTFTSLPVTIQPAADLRIAKTDGPDPVVAGQTLTYTLAVANDGPSAATSVSVSDTLPAGVTFLTASGTGWTCTESGGVVTCTRPTLAVGPAPNITITVRPSSGGTILNSATVSSATLDPDPADNTATAETTVTPVADLSVQKSVAPATPTLNANVTFTVTLRNDGPNPATGVAVRDQLPAGLTFVSSNPSQGLYNSSTGVWTAGTVNTNATATLEIVATVTSLSSITNTAQVSASNELDPDSTPNNNAAGEDDQASVTIRVPSADLSVSKTSSSPTPALGSNVTFTVTVTNSGADGATGVALRDQLPSGLAFISATPTQGSYVSATGLWTVGSLTSAAPGNSASIQIVARVDQLGVLSNSAQVTASDQADPDSLPGNNVPAEDDQASVSVQAPSADLSVSKAVSNATPAVNDLITFTVTVRNSGPDDAPGVVVADPLPSGLVFDSATASQGTYDAPSGNWSVGLLPAGASRVLTIVARVTSLAPITNTAQVSAAGVTDPDSAPGNGVATEDDQASVTISVPTADLRLTKAQSVGPTSPKLGETVTFLVTVTNDGLNEATGVVVSDRLPGGLTYVSHAASVGTYVEGTGTWTVGSLANGVSATLEIVARATTVGSATNTAQVAASDQADPDSTPNNDAAGEDDQGSVTLTVLPRVADLSVAKTTSTASPSLGAVITFTITLTSAGPDDATGVSVADQLPAGLAFVGATPSQGTYDQTSGVWSVGTLPSASAATLQVQARVTTLAGLTNTAQVISSDQPDPDSTPNNNNAGEDDQSSVTVRVPSADLSLQKTASSTTPVLGSNVTYTVTLRNAGPDTATGVVVGDPLPAGLSFVSATPSVGSYASASGLWNVGTLASGGVATLQVVARVNSIASQTNTAQVASADQADPDSVPGNSAGTEDDQAAVTLQVPAADLSITKAVSNASPRQGQAITYTVTVSNAGPGPASGVTVDDTLPAGLTFQAASPSQGTYDALTGLWNVGGITAGQSATLSIVAIPTTLGSITNRAQVAASDQSDPDSIPGNDVASEDDQASVPITVGRRLADLTVAKSVSTSAPTLNATVAFTVSVTNDGPDDATGVTVSDRLPIGVSFLSASSPAYDSGTGVWTVGTVLVGQTATLTIQARVDSTNPITNVAQVATADVADPDSTPGNSDVTEDDQAQVSLKVPVADLALVKSTSTTTPSLGSTFTFTVDVSNGDQEQATGVTVAEALPTGLEYVSHVTTAGTYDPLAGVWNVGVVDSDATVSLEITVRVTQLGAITNTAQIATSDQLDLDSTPGNGIAGEDDQSSATIRAPEADLSLSKAVDNPAPRRGDPVEFTITLRNAGPDSATGVSVTDLLPPGLLFLSATPSQGTYDQVSGLWTVGAIPAGQLHTLRIRATVDTFDPVTNVAQVTASDLPDPDSAPNNNAPTEDDQTSATLGVPNADLSLTKSASTLSPTLGSNVVFTITVRNDGPAVATGVNIADTFPAGLTPISSTQSQGIYNGLTRQWSVGTLGIGASATLTLTARVDALGPQTNTAEISGVDQQDPDSTPGNNVAGEDDQATATVRAPEADLSLAKVVSNATPALGDNVTFTVTLTNAGPDAASGVTISDRLPAGLEFVSAAPSQGTYVAASGVWTVGTVPSTGTATLGITATVTALAALQNTAQVATSDLPDPDSAPGNNNAAEDDQATAGLRAPSADLSLTKTVDDTNPPLNSNVVFTVTVANAGPDAATGVTVRDVLPAGLTLINVVPGVEVYDPVTGIWNVGTVPAGGTRDIRIRANVDDLAPKTNTAQVATADQPDPDSTPGNSVATEDDQASARLAAQNADLSLAKTVSSGSPAFGSNVTFTLTVTNTGPDPATGVAVADQLPAGLVFVSSNPSQGAYDVATGVWSVGTVPVTESRTLEIVARVDSIASIDNAAQIITSDLPDPDSTPGNGNPAEDDQATASLRAPSADVSITKSVDDPSPAIGQAVTFTVAVQNAGPDVATGVQVTDALPAGLTFISATPTVGTFAGGVWTVGDVALGATPSLAIRARVNVLTQVTNVAQVTAAGVPDPDSTPGNNVATEDDQAQAALRVPSADLSVVKRVSTASPALGTNVTFTIDVTNSGPDPATGVEVLDQLPAGLSFGSATASQGTYVAATGVWATGSLPVGATASLQIVAGVTALGALANAAEVNAADQTDPDSRPDNQAPGEDDLSTVSLRAPESDLSLTKVSSNPAPRLGEPFTFTLTLSNAGPDAATAIQVADPLPAGLTLNGPPPAGYDPATGVWSVASLASGASAALILPVRATVLGPLANTAQVDDVDQADPDSTPGNGVIGEDDHATAPVNIGPQIADLSLAKTASSATVAQGAEFTYTLTLSNAGPDAATAVRVADPLPTGLAFVSATPQGTASYDDATGVWTVPSLASGTTTTLDIRVRVTGTGDILNTAQVALSDQLDPDSTPANGVATEDDHASASIHVPTADLSLAKTTSNAAPRLGQAFDFVLTLANAGPDTATGIRVRDILPVGIILAGAPPAGYDPATGIWTIASVASGATATLTLPVRATLLGPITNAAQVEASDQADPNSTPGNGVVGEDDQASVGVNVTPQVADLSLTKTPSTTTPSRGSTLTYTIVVSNAGPDTATGVEVADPLPVGLQFVSAAPASGTFNPATTIWAIPSIPSGGDATLVITAQVTGILDLSNTAQIAASDQLDPDSTPANDAAAEDDQATATVHVPTADLLVTKTTDDPAPRVGNDFTFTISVNNNGPDQATGVVIGDALPAPLTLSASVASQGVYNSLTGDWGVGTLDPGATATLALTVQIPVSVDPATLGSVANSAQVMAVDQADPDSTPANGDTGEDDQASALVFPGPQIADLSVTKAVDNPSAPRGSIVDFTVRVTNAGPDAATDVAVGDAIPAGLAFLGAVPSQGTFNPATGTWQLVDPLAINATAVLVITARVTGTGRLENVAQVTSTDQFDPDSTPANDAPLEDDQASAVINVPTADLSLAKATSNATPRLGQAFDYTVTIANAGPDPATNVEVRDILPAGIALVGAPPAGYDPLTGIWDVPTPLAPAASATLTLTVAASRLGPISNAAQVVASDQADPDSGPDNGVVGEDDQTAVGVDVQPQLADLDLQKTTTTPVVARGADVTFTLRLVNSGPDAATNVNVSDVLPAGLEFVSANPSDRYTSSTGIWSIGTIGSGDSATLELTARVTGTGDLTNVAQVATSDQLDPDSSPANGLDTEDDQAQATIHVPTADLAIAKTTSNPSPRLGQAFDYEITLANTGPDAATGVQVRDVLPTGVTLVAPNPDYDGATGIWTVPGSVPALGSATLTLSVQSTVLGPLLNTAQVAASDQADPDSTPANGVVGEDDQAAVGVNVGPQLADLELTKSPGNATVARGGLVTFTLTLNNVGPDTATGVTIADPIPVGLQFVSAAPAAAYDDATGLWTVGSISSGGTAAIDITARVTGTGDIVNVAQVASSDQLDPDSSPANGLTSEDDQSQSTIHVPTADLSLTKTVSNASPRLGETFSYVITVTNAGPDTATGVQVRDVLPVGIVLAGLPPGGYDPATGIWLVPPVGSGSSLSLTLAVQATVLDPISNTAEIVAADQADPDSTPDNGLVAEDDQAGVTIGVPVADLSLTKTVDNTAPRLGQTVTFTLTLANAGPGAATNVSVVDQLPSGLTLVSAVPTEGTYTAVTGEWTLAAVGPGASATLRITATVTTLGPLTNGAQVTASDQADGDSQPGNGVATEDDQSSASLTVGPQVADLTLTKTADATSVAVGDEIVYTLTLRNEGPDTATGVRVLDTFPTTLAYVSSAPSVGSFDPSSGTWTVPTIANGGTATLTLRARIVGAGPIENMAQITASDQVDPDSVPGNGVAAEDDQGTVSVAGVTAPTAQLSVTKSAARRVRGGDTLIYTIRVRNVGPVAATDVVVRDVLPRGISLARRPRGTTFRKGVLTWRIPTLAPGETRQLRLTTTVALAARGTRRNTVAASAANASTVRARAVTTIRPGPRPGSVIVTG